ncbi:DNA-3-methyladenine glycosylase family protein [Geminocystis herdmanii]|uniref:DNA-3-methyladenine glycosylase family protein n=1 Tax=Geminocystis herdmanii TaxID=669359 RepID=UPI00034A5436|nr:DNA-3-methyladenine glycosylase [Geminocystis herdmanii]
MSINHKKLVKPITPLYWQKALELLTHQDKIIGNLIITYPDEILTNHHNPFHTLIRAVVGQQISVKAAEAVWQRLATVLESITPHSFLTSDREKLRQCGLSRQKINYITNVANAFHDGLLTPNTWEYMSDHEIIKQLTQIKGIGEWSAQMFLIFHLHRPDILPLADLGLINAIYQHYGNMTKAEIITLSQQWQPYRTVAVWYLWRSLDPFVIQY